MLYHTRTYIAADFDHDRNAVEKLYEWNNDKHRRIEFTDAHDLQSSRDTSLPCSIKKSLAYRMSGSKRFVLIVGEHTNSITKGSCQWCNSYNRHTRQCVRNHPVDYRSYIEFECEQAVKQGLKIIVLYKSTQACIKKCPEILRQRGIHIPMIYYSNGQLYWNYNVVKKAFDETDEKFEENKI